MCMGFGQQVLIPPTERARLMADYLRSCFVLLLLLVLTEFLAYTKLFSGIFDLLGVGLGYLAIRSSEGYNYQQGTHTPRTTTNLDTSHTRPHHPPPHHLPRLLSPRSPLPSSSPLSLPCACPVLCFLMLQTVFGILSLVDLIFYFAGVAVAVAKTPTLPWMFAFYIAALMAAPIIYSLTVYFTYSIYKEMKVVVDEMVSGIQRGGEAPASGPLMGNGYDVQAPRREERQQPALWRHAESHPAPPPAAAAAAAAPAPAAGGVGGGFQAFSGTGRKLGE